MLLSQTFNHSPDCQDICRRLCLAAVRCLLCQQQTRLCSGGTSRSTVDPEGQQGLSIFISEASTEYLTASGLMLIALESPVLVSEGTAGDSLSAGKRVKMDGS